MSCCWSEWHGPRVEESVHGRCSVHTCIAYNLTHGENRYHYMAPCRIESISEDGNTIIAVVDYPTEGVTHAGIIACARNYNGERLRLDITEVWAPVADLIDHEEPEPPAPAPPKQPVRSLFDIIQPAKPRPRTLFDLMKARRAGNETP